MNWKETNHRFIAFFDIMGFKDFVQRRPHDAVLRKMKKFKAIIEPVEAEARRLLNRNTSITPSTRNKLAQTIARPFIFSDSIIITTNGNSLLEAQKILIVSHWVLNKCFEIGLPVKGAVSYGKLTADFSKSIFFGQPLIDAYLLQDELQMYGVLLDHNFESYLHKNKIIDENYDWVKYKTPLKSGKVNHLILNWHNRHNRHKFMENHIRKLYKTVSGKPRVYVDNTWDCLKFLIEKKKNDDT